MSIAPRVGVNPLPWIMSPDRFDLSRATIEEAVRGVAAAGFGAIHADVPNGMPAADYTKLLGDHGLLPAPGYFSAHYDVSPKELAATVEAAKRHASLQMELGLTEVFLASHLHPVRIAAPAVGAGFEASRLNKVIEAIAATAAAITSEGLRPCFHPHVGSWIETPAEIRALLNSVGPESISFGPDTGHILWAGGDPAQLVSEYADRVGAVHLKDVHLAVGTSSQGVGDDYWQTTYEKHVWTEPGRGDVDFAAVLAALPSTYRGWFVVEVDVPDGMSKENSTLTSARWVDSHTQLFPSTGGQ